MIYSFYIWDRLYRFYGKGQVVLLVSKNFNLVFPYLSWDINIKHNKMTSLHKYYEVASFDIENVNTDMDFDELRHFIDTKKCFSRRFLENLRIKYQFFDLPLIEIVSQKLTTFGRFQNTFYKYLCVNILFKTMLEFHRQFVSFEFLVREIFQKEFPNLLKDRFYFLRILNYARTRTRMEHGDVFIKFPYDAKQGFVLRSTIPLIYEYVKTHIERVKPYEVV